MIKMSGEQHRRMLQRGIYTPQDPNRIPCVGILGRRGRSSQADCRSFWNVL